MPNSAQREENEIEAGSTRDKVADTVGMGRNELEKLVKIKYKTVVPNSAQREKYKLKASEAGIKLQVKLG